MTPFVHGTVPEGEYGSLIGSTSGSSIQTDTGEGTNNISDSDDTHLLDVKSQNV